MNLLPPQTARRLSPARRRGRQSETGAATAELAGALIIAALLIAGFLAAAPDMGRRIVCAVGTAISSVVGSDWSCSDTGGDDPDPHKPTEPCTNKQNSYKANMSVDVPVWKSVSVGGEVNGGIVVEQLSDGTYRVTDSRGMKVSVGASGGDGGAYVNVDGVRYGTFQGAGASLSATGELGATYIVDSEQAKDDLVGYLTRQGVAQATGPLGMGLNGIYDALDGYEPPKPEEYYVEFGNEVSASADVVEGTSGAGGKIGGSRAVGARVNVEEGTVTTYFRVNVGASGEASMAPAGAEAAEAAEMMIAVTVDADNPEKLLNVTATGMADASIGIAGLNTSPTAEAGVMYSASLDLTSAESESIARDLLSAAGIESGGRPGMEGVKGARDTFLEAVQDRGVLTRQNVSRDSTGVSGQVGLPEVGFGGGLTAEELTFSNGEYFDGQDWRSWDGC